jgi:hypothetical protein
MEITRNCNKIVQQRDRKLLKMLGNCVRELSLAFFVEFLD